MLGDLHVGQVKPNQNIAIQLRDKRLQQSNTIKRQKAIGTLHVGQDKKQNQTLCTVITTKTIQEVSKHTKKSKVNN